MKRTRRIRTVPISAIAIINSRERSEHRFKELVTSIEKLGLKRPITVSNKSGSFELVCGEGRINALVALGQTKVPAIVVDAPTEECLLMSLIENIARRRRTPVELVREIGRLAKQYNTTEIAAKLDLTPEYVRALAYLLKHGEERVISAIERGVMPPTLALEIARAKSPKVQGALLEAYVNERHTSKQIAKMRKLVEQRHHSVAAARRAEGEISSKVLVRAYQQETERQEVMARQAELTQARLEFIVNALRTLLEQRMFATMLRKEKLDKLPLSILRRLSFSQLDT